MAHIFEMVGVAGFEPAAHWSQTSCATKLRYTPTNNVLLNFLEMVGVAGFEPAAHWSQTSCATKLRYTPSKNLAGAEGLEPSARGFGDHCSTN